MTRKITLAGLALGAAVVFLGGCGRHKAVGEIEAITTEVCACKDRPCVMEGIKKATELQVKYKDDRVSNTDYEAVNAASKRLQECVDRILK